MGSTRLLVDFYLTWQDYTKTESWTGGGEKIRKELPTIRKMRKVDIWEERSGHSLVISS